MAQGVVESDTDERAGAVPKPPRFTLTRFLTAGIIGIVGAAIVFVGVAFIYERLFDEEGQIVRFIWFSAFGFGLSAGSYLGGLRKAKALTLKHAFLSLAIGVVVGLGFGLLGMEHLSNETWPIISAAGVAGLMGLRIFG